jgi:hypothetical protein
VELKVDQRGFDAVEEEIARMADWVDWMEPTLPSNPDLVKEEEALAAAVVEVLRMDLHKGSLVVVVEEGGL